MIVRFFNKIVRIFKKFGKTKFWLETTDRLPLSHALSDDFKFPFFYRKR